MSQQRGAEPDSREASVAARALRRWICLSLAVAVAAPLANFALLFPFVGNIPRWDQWSLVELWEAHYEGRPVLPLLLKPYNHHLNILPRVLFYGLGVATDWDLRIEVLLSYLLAACTAATLLLMLRDSGKELLLLAAPFSAVVFSFVQCENFLSGYPMGQVLSQLAYTLTVFSLTRPRIGNRHIAAATAAAAVATFSWGAGLTAWFVGVVALAFRRRRGMLIFWCSLTVACFAIVARGAGSQGHIGLKGLMDFDTPFFLALVGRGFTHRAFPDFAAAASVGLVLILAFTFTLDETLRSRQCLLGLRWGLLGGAALAGVVMITLSRSKAGPGQALASHYVTAAYPVALSALAMASHALLTWRRRAMTRLRRAGITLLLAALISLPLVMVVAQSRQMFFILRGWVQISREHDQKLLAGTITDDEIRGSLHPDPDLVRRGVVLLREHRLAVFAESRR